jgi:Phage tail protein (Tail_P2_I)
MADLQLQPSIATDLRAQALLELIERLKDPSLGGTLDLSSILVYRMASLVDSAVLPMAWQWDVLNPLLLPVATELVNLEYANWDEISSPDSLTNTDLLQFLSSITESGAGSLAIRYAQYRALILLSTQLHSIMGTKGAMEQALSGLGYPNAQIQEGQNSWGGNSYPPNEGWAVFRILIDLLTVPAGTDMSTLLERITAIANYWKPARSWLDAVSFTLALSDALSPPISDSLASTFQQFDLIGPLPADFLAGQFAPVVDTKTIVPFHNNQYYFGSSITYGGTQPAVSDGPVIVNGNAIAH